MSTYVNLETKDVYKNRLEAKLAVGGSANFNRLFKSKKIIFVNDDTINYLDDLLIFLKDLNNK